MLSTRPIWVWTKWRGPELLWIYILLYMQYSHFQAKWLFCNHFLVINMLSFLTFLFPWEFCSLFKLWVGNYILCAFHFFIHNLHLLCTIFINLCTMPKSWVTLKFLSFYTSELVVCSLPILVVVSLDYFVCLGVTTRSGTAYAL